MDTHSSIPAHVPAALVRDIDLYNLPGSQQDVHLAWKRVQDECPDIFYTPRYGGHWVIARAELLDRIWADHERFSSDRAVGIPRMPDVPAQLPIEVDPPTHRYFREPLNLALSPKAVQHLAERARASSIELIENFRPKGACEFVSDFAEHVPMEVFLSIVDLPASDREWLVRRASTMARNPSLEAKGQAQQEIFGYLGGWLQKRRSNLGEDLLSKILQVQVGDRPITADEAMLACALALFGGLETVASAMSFSMRYLALYPEQRRQLTRHPEQIPAAVEELLRRYSIPTVGRRLTQDVILNGVTMKAGDYVQLTSCLHGLDERKWPNSLRVDFDRMGLDGHMAFGRGIHKCPGANLARAELRVFLEEWLPRIPDFGINPGAEPITASGSAAGVLRLPLVWPV